MSWLELTDDHQMRFGTDAGEYSLIVECGNCGSSGTLPIPSGELLIAQQCPRCQCCGTLSRTTPSRWNDHLFDGFKPTRKIYPWTKETG